MQIQGVERNRSIAALLEVSMAVTAVALAGFGYVKGVFTGAKPFRTTLQTLLVGGLAAGAAFTLARSFS